MANPRRTSTPRAPGLYGLVFRVADLDSAKEEFAADGIEPMDEYEVGDVLAC